MGYLLYNLLTVVHLSFFHQRRLVFLSDQQPGETHIPMILLTALRHGTIIWHCDVYDIHCPVALELHGVLQPKCLFPIFHRCQAVHKLGILAENDIQWIWHPAQSNPSCRFDLVSVLPYYRQHATVIVSLEMLAVLPRQCNCLLLMAPGYSCPRVFIPDRLLEFVLKEMHPTP